MYIDSSNSYNNCCCHDGHGKGDFMMTESLADILGSIGVNVKYPHDAQTPDRLRVTRKRANELKSIQVQSVEDYRDQFKREILAILSE